MFVINGRKRDLGDGFTVSRLLPVAQRRLIGPFVFFDHMGPIGFAPGNGIDVRPHPHIGLATVTYLFAGSIMHRDNLGSVQRIEPGDVNWMVAGRGIVHSERTDASERKAGQRLHGVQSWVALPLAEEETAPGFVHIAAKDLPVRDQDGVFLRVIAGHAFGLKAPVPVLSPTLYLDLDFREGGTLALSDEHAERAIFIAEGSLEINGMVMEADTMVVFDQGEPVVLTARDPTRALALGGATLDGGPRHIEWNFVSSRKERIETAKADWRAQRFGPVPGESDFIPLPGG
jgi:redox-sensitive bicupin YhaK (pirin superfamily)